MKDHKHHKHKLHEEMRREAVAEFLGKEKDFHNSVHKEVNKHYFRFLAVFGGFIMIALFTSFALFSPVQGVLEGRLRSSVIDNNIVNFGDYSVYFSKKVASVLPSLYEDNQLVNGVEAAVCLMGEYVGEENYQVDDIYHPEIYSQSFGSVTFAPCPQETVIMLHTHPFKSCLASDADLVALNNAKISNPDVMMIIMCENYRFSVYP